MVGIVSSERYVYILIREAYNILSQNDISRLHSDFESLSNHFTPTAVQYQ